LASSRDFAGADQEKSLKAVPTEERGELLMIVRSPPYERIEHEYEYEYEKIS
jgi:hypothetical protein